MAVRMDRKMKSQKAKSKSSEGRKQLSSVRVIQRNLVYIVGLPLNLADEDVIFLAHLLPLVSILCKFFPKKVLPSHPQTFILLLVLSVRF